MPNAVQKFANHLVKRLRRAASSTSSPPIGQPPADVTIEAEPTGDICSPITPAGAIIRKEVPIQNHLTPENVQSVLKVHSSRSFETSVQVSREPEAEDDVIIELEAMKNLRIEDALTESRKMQETFDKRPRATNIRRLMKELRQLQKASQESNGTFEVELCSDGDSEDGHDLSDWEVRFFKFDESSNLWKSMQEHGIDCVKFRVTFPSDFPFSPPFVRLVSPYIENGFVMNGGAICLEVLTNQGWSSAYTVEALLVQVAASLSHGGAVVSKHQKRKQHKLTQKRAEVEFRRIIKIHNKYGWVKLEKNEG
ncbi:unnamed protein product [Clavelina lepadiformis]|uniref:UBC core domain-containing protein n=1 Tax=Clavelina lepadiformis TaxID=159417 RepID=A0ABP0GWN6_CLALP